MNEQTAGYFLAQALLKAYSERGARAIPIAYWSNREGGRLGIESGHDIQVQIAAIFPRRPKVLSPNAPTSIVKFNQILFDAKEIGTKIGLPVFAGVPLVTSLFELGSSTTCAWFGLRETRGAFNEAYCSIDLRNPTPLFRPDPEIFHITETELIDQIDRDSKTKDWPTWSNDLSNFKHMLNMRGGHVFFGPPYKPMFILLPQMSTGFR